MVTFQEFLFYLRDVGVLEVLLPFILIFTVIFAILQKVQVLGDKSKRYNVMIALVIALSVVFQHILYPSQNDAVNLLSRVFPTTAIFIIATLTLFLLLGLWGATPNWKKGSGGIVTIIAIIIIIGIFTYAAGWWGAGTTLPSWLSWLSDPGTISVIIIVLVFVIVIGYITSDDEGKKDDGTFKKFREGLGELFGGS